MEGVSFFEQVYEVVKLIPKGRATSYGAIALYLSASKSARMVGWAMNASRHDLQHIPAHRVVNRNGLLTGKRHFGGAETMKQLLENEGIIIENDQIQNWQSVYWDPSKELSFE